MAQAQVLPFEKPKKKTLKRPVIDQLSIRKANEKLKEHAGVDFLAIIMGDDREMQRLRMKQYAHAMEEMSENLNEN
jgi:hypothetical protein